MKLIIAYIRPIALDQVKVNLNDIGLRSFSVIPNALGFGLETNQKFHYRGAVMQVDHHPKMRLEIAVDNDTADAAVDAILLGARTGKTGDGRVFVVELAECNNIHNSFRNEPVAVETH